MENNINIELIMAQIKNDIRQQNLTPDMLSFEDIPYEQPVRAESADSISAEKAEAAFRHMNLHYYVKPYRKLKGNPVSVFFQRAVRKLIMFCIEPNVSEQNNFNAAAVTAMNYLRISSGKADNADLIERVGAVERLHTGLIKRLERLEKENASLRAELELLRGTDGKA